MLHLPPLSRILEHAYGPAPTAAPEAAAATGNDKLPPSGQIAALLRIQAEHSIEPAFVLAADQQRKQDLLNRSRVDALLSRLQAGDAIPPFRPLHPPLHDLCFRFENNVLAIASHDAFGKRQTPAFEIHLHGPGVMTRQDGAWIQDPDAAFFDALDTACRSAQRASVG